MSDNVSIVIVSHSVDVAKGTADMVRQMVGEEVRVAFCRRELRMAGLALMLRQSFSAIESVWSPKGVAVLVDLGGAETNSEMAIEMLSEDKGANVQICDAPVVEGAVMAATEAASGASLEAVRATAEDF